MAARLIATLTFVCLIGTGIVSGIKECLPEDCLIIENCRCAFAGPETPGHLNDRSNIPQFVTMTFHGPINNEISSNIQKIFSSPRRSADGCLYKATFFVPGQFNVWSEVRQLYEDGHEVGGFSNSFKTEQEYWRTIKQETINEEAQGIRDALHHEVGIPKSEIRGWRTPLLAFGGDVMMRGLQQAEYTYDSSLKMDSENKIWPFTMDHGWPDDKNCNRFTNACFKKPHRGFWEVPVVNHENWQTGDKMATFSELVYTDAKEIFNVMKTSFDSYHAGKRAPFMLTFASSYFTGELAEIRIKAVTDFMDYVESKPDVHVKTLHDVLKWVKNPSTAVNMRDACVDKTIKLEEPKPKPNFDLKQLTRYQLFLYYYSVNRSHASHMQLALISLIAPLFLFLKNLL